MNQPSSPQREFASRLLERERPGESAEERAAAAGRVYEKLSLCLAPLVGSTGVRALLARSLILMSGEFPFLSGASFEHPEGAADRLRTSLQGQRPDDALRAAAALFGSFLTLLATYVGERLTAQILRTAWPDLAAQFSKETK